MEEERKAARDRRRSRRNKIAVHVNAMWLWNKDLQRLRTACPFVLLLHELLHQGHWLSALLVSFSPSNCGNLFWLSLHNSYSDYCWILQGISSSCADSNNIHKQSKTSSLLNILRAIFKHTVAHLDPRELKMFSAAAAVDVLHHQLWCVFQVPFWLERKISCDGCW